MKKLVIAALIAAQTLAAAQPAFAADFIEAGTHQAGAFGGLRVRLPLDGRADRRQVRAGLALAPALHSRVGSGEYRMQMGEGLEFGLRGERVQLSLAGTPVSRLAQGGTAPEGRRANISPIAWVAIGVGVAVVGVATWFVIAINDDDRCCE